MTTYEPFPGITRDDMISIIKAQRIEIEALKAERDYPAAELQRYRACFGPLSPDLPRTAEAWSVEPDDDADGSQRWLALVLGIISAGLVIAGLSWLVEMMR